MYCDLNNLIHDLEIMSRVSNCVQSLRYQYNGLTVELSEQISTEIRNEIRRKDAQITLIDRSCFQLRIRSKNYKDVICIQMSDPEAKKDWLTDVRLAKLALDRGNNPAWDIVNENISSSNGNIHAMTQQRVPLFVKSLPIFATTGASQLTCALYYKLYSGLPGLETSSGVLWICNVNENGSQLGALATNGADVSLIHSYELCDSHVTCLESVSSSSVWVGLRQGRVIVIDAASPGEWQQLAALEVAGEVTCMRHFGQHVYVGLKTGVVTLFDVQHYEEPVIITLSQAAVTCLLPIENEVYACSGNKIWVISGAQVKRSYCLDGAEEDNCGSTANGFDGQEVQPYLLAHCGIGLWVSLINSSIIRLYHTETFKHLQDLNVASNVKRILPDAGDAPITVTSMLATRGLLWVGTNVGIIVTLTLPRLQGVPLVSGALNVALHRHLGPVTILLSLTSSVDMPIASAKTPNGKSLKNSRRTSLEAKHDDMESIYGLYSDLMKVGEYGGTRPPPLNQAATRLAWDMSHMAISDDSTSESASNNAMYQDGRRLPLPVAVRQLSPTEAQLPRDPAAGDHLTGEQELIAGEQPYSEAGIYDASPRSPRSAQLKIGQRHEREPIYGTSSPEPIGSHKTALLLTGGNGYKRGTQDSPYSSQHAHCIIWEYKL